MYREQRLVAACRVEFGRLGHIVSAETEDLSRHGLFLRTTEFLPVGEVVELTIYLPIGTCKMISRVVHLLSVQAARDTGRHPGMGFEFLEGNRDRRALLKRYLDDLLDEVTPLPGLPREPMRVLVVDASARMLDRLSRVLAEAGLRVEAASDGGEAYGICLRRPPDAILVSDQMPVVDGWTFVRMLQQRPGLTDVPVALLSDDTRDITRLSAYRLGVRDFIVKPFTDDEIVLRVRRLYQPRGELRGDKVSLRGALEEISLPTLLSLLDYERKTGTLVLLRQGGMARLFVSHGRVVRLEGPTGAPPGESSLRRLYRLLDWPDGVFELLPGDIVGGDDLGVSTQQLLLEHARLRDEKK